MARYAPLTLDNAAALPGPSTRTTSKSTAPKRSLLQRMVAALAQARTRQAEREVAHYLAMTGGRMTDTVERELERRLAGNRLGLL